MLRQFLCSFFWSVNSILTSIFQVSHFRTACHIEFLLSESHSTLLVFCPRLYPAKLNSEQWCLGIFVDYFDRTPTFCGNLIISEISSSGRRAKSGCVGLAFSSVIAKTTIPFSATIVYSYIYGTAVTFSTNSLFHYVSSRIQPRFIFTLPIDWMYPGASHRFSFPRIHENTSFTWTIWLWWSHLIHTFATTDLY